MLRFYRANPRARLFSKTYIVWIPEVGRFTGETGLAVNPISAWQLQHQAQQCDGYQAIPIYACNWWMRLYLAKLEICR